MSSPLVIQQRVKALHHLGSSAPSDFFVPIGEIHKFMKIILFGAGFWPSFFFISSKKGTTGESEGIATVVTSTILLFMALSAGIFLMGVRWFLACARGSWDQNSGPEVG